MSLISFLKRAAAGVIALGFAASAFAQYTIDFSSATGAGISSNKVLLQNIRVYTPVAGSAPVETDYSAIITFQPNSLTFVPASIVQTGGIGTNACAVVNVSVINATNGSPVQGASVTMGASTVATNASGLAQFSALASTAYVVGVVANGYTTTSQVNSFNCGSNSVAVALSPGSGQSGGLGSSSFRTILTWGADPADLDSHMTGPVAGSTSRWHVYYADPSGGSICGLDHDDTTSYGPETITCPATGTSTILPNGVYRYSVHHYSGNGTIGTSGATVRLEFGNGTVYNYTPPATGWSGYDDVWTVFELTVNNGNVSVAPVNTVTNGVSPGSVSAPKQGVIQFGQPESPSMFTNRSK